MNAKEKWIDEALNSINEVQRVNVSNLLSYKIHDRLKKQNALFFNTSTTWVIAACLLFLITLNTIVVISYNKTTKNNRQEISSISNMYFDYTEQF